MIYYNKNKVKKFQRSGVLSDKEAPFNPEGGSYDYDTAIKYGIGPDETGHWPSRVPETGQLLKGSNHETFHKTVAGESAAGYEIYKGADGKYYSKRNLRSSEIKAPAVDRASKPVYLKSYNPNRPKYNNTVSNEQIGPASTDRSYDINRRYVVSKETPVRNAVIKGADIATDVAQLGNFIPHPAAQTVGKVGGILGSFIDSAQAIKSFSNGDTTGGIINTASSILPSFLSSKTFRRNSKYLNKSNPLYWTQRGARRPGLLAQPDRVRYINTDKNVRGMKATQLAINRALLSGVVAETVYDAAEAPFSKKPLVPPIKY